MFAISLTVNKVILGSGGSHAQLNIRRGNQIESGSDVMVSRVASQHCQQDKALITACLHTRSH